MTRDTRYTHAMALGQVREAISLLAFHNDPAHLDLVKRLRAIENRMKLMLEPAKEAV